MGDPFLSIEHSRNNDIISPFKLRRNQITNQVSQFLSNKNPNFIPSSGRSTPIQWNGKESHSLSSVEKTPSKCKTTKGENNCTTKSKFVLLKQPSTQVPKSKYRVLSYLGKGIHGKVYLALNLATQKQVTMKKVSKCQWHKDSDLTVQKQITKIKMFHHPNISTVLDYYATENAYYIIMDYLIYGDLSKYIKSEWNESQWAVIFYQVLTGIMYLHEKNLWDLGLKIDDIWINDIEMNNNEGNLFWITIGDIVTKSTLHNRMKEKEGDNNESPYGESIEIKNNTSNYRNDIWSVGVMLYMLIVGITSINNGDTLLPCNNNEFINLKHDKVLSVSNELRDLITKWLDINGDKTLTAHEAWKHPWFIIQNGSYLYSKLSRETINMYWERIMKHQVISKQQWNVFKYLSDNLPTPVESKDIFKWFLLLSSDDEGRISKSDWIFAWNPNVTPRQINKTIDNIFSCVDKDNKGFISYNDFFIMCLDKDELLSYENLTSLSLEMYSDREKYIQGIIDPYFREDLIETISNHIHPKDTHKNYRCDKTFHLGIKNEADTHTEIKDKKQSRFDGSTKSLPKNKRTIVCDFDSNNAAKCQNNFANNTHNTNQKKKTLNKAMKYINTTTETPKSNKKKKRNWSSSQTSNIATKANLTKDTITNSKNKRTVSTSKVDTNSNNSKHNYINTSLSKSQIKKQDANTIRIKSNKTISKTMQKYWNKSPLVSCHREEVLGDSFDIINYINPILELFVISFNDLTVNKSKPWHYSELSTVYIGTYLNLPVTVKEYKNVNSLSSTDYQCLQNEINLCVSLHHPNIVTFIGWASNDNNIYLITEYLPNWSWKEIIEKSPNLWTPKVKLNIIKDIASGLYYLSRRIPAVYHRDWKSSNILWDKCWTAKLCDFGISKVKDEFSNWSTNTQSTPYWMAPEFCIDGTFSHKSDIYSFGILIWEIVMEDTIPYKNANIMDYIIGVKGIVDKRPEIDTNKTNSIKGIKELMEMCWKTNPTERPDMKEIVEVINHIFKGLEFGLCVD